jgi:hypothetical protein
MFDPSFRKRRLAALIGAIVLAVLVFVPNAGAAPRTVRYGGYAIDVPRSWPVYDLDADPSRCVRFDRHAVYIGTPGADQRCPAHAVGRTEAILVQPLDRSAVSQPGALTLGRRAVAPKALPGSANEARLNLPGPGLSVTANWRRSRPLVERILRGARRTTKGRTLRAATLTRAAGPVAAPSHRATASASFRTGLGFDACSAPSTTTVTAWTASPYRTIGVYIGGVNRACSQTNLTSSWVAAVVGAGWGLIPTYVGVQAPGNSCGCAAIKPAQAAAQGTAAADDAVTQAAALGIGPGNPIYYDMEGYSLGGSTSSAVLTFLGAWTTEIHARGYVSGVYGSAASTITDLAGQYGSGYPVPDDVWIARWNNQQSTADPAVPATAWANHQRLHQYQGGHNERYGGVTINIDSDYIDGAVVGTASDPVVPVRRRCPRVVFNHRRRSAAMKIRTINLRCSSARKVAAASRPKQFTALEHSRVYSKRRFTCRGHRVGRARVIYSCTHRTARVSFVRQG